MMLMLLLLLCGVRFQAYEQSFKPLCDLFDWWERAVGSLAASFLAEQQADQQEDKATKKGKKQAGKGKKQAGF